MEKDVSDILSFLSKKSMHSEIMDLKTYHKVEYLIENPLKMEPLMDQHPSDHLEQ